MRTGLFAGLAGLRLSPPPPIPSLLTRANWCVVRHALPLTPDGTPAARHCYGQTNWPADEALTQRAAQHLTQQGPAPQPGSVMRCSPLTRCQQLAQAVLSRQPQWTLVLDPRLMEMHFGEWEGRPWDDVPRPELDAWNAHFANHRMGGHGESVVDLLKRVSNAARDDLERSAAQPVALGTESAATASRPTLWITHAGVIRALQWLQQQPDWPQTQHETQTLRASDWPMQAPAYGAWRWL